MQSEIVIIVRRVVVTGIGIARVGSDEFTRWFRSFEFVGATNFWGNAVLSLIFSDRTITHILYKAYFVERLLIEQAVLFWRGHEKRVDKRKQTIEADICRVESVCAGKVLHILKRLFGDKVGEVAVSSEIGDDIWELASGDAVIGEDALYAISDYVVYIVLFAAIRRVYNAHIHITHHSHCIIQLIVKQKERRRRFMGDTN